MTPEDKADDDTTLEALDAEVREDEAVWNKARAEFDQFRKDQKGQPPEQVEKAFHKWLRHHGITMQSDEFTTKAAQVAAGEAVEL